MSTFVVNGQPETDAVWQREAAVTVPTAILDSARVTLTVPTVERRSSFSLTESRPTAGALKAMLSVVWPLKESLKKPPRLLAADATRTVCFSVIPTFADVVICCTSAVPAAVYHSTLYLETALPPSLAGLAHTQFSEVPEATASVAVAGALGWERGVPVATAETGPLPRELYAITRAKYLRPVVRFGIVMRFGSEPLASSAMTMAFSRPESDD